MKSSIGLTVFKVMTIAFVLAITTCGIVDMAVSGTVTWSGYSLISIVYAWLVLTPPLVSQKNKTFSMLAMASVATLPYLFLLDYILPGGTWFIMIGVPVGFTSLAALWVTYAIFKYLKVNNWFKAAFILFLYGILLSGITLYSVGTFFGDSMSLLLTVSTMVNFTVITGLTVILLAQGFGKQIRQNAARTVEGFQRQ